MARSNMRTSKRAPKDLGRRVKKKPCQLCKDRMTWVDYKNANLLKRFMSERGKIRARRVSGNCEQHQHAVAEAIKTARELALLPYVQRTVTERRGSRRDRDGGRRGGRDSEESMAPASDDRRGDRHVELDAASGDGDEDNGQDAAEAPEAEAEAAEVGA